MNRQESCTGSAFVIAPVNGTRLLLTNAHVVRDHATVRVRRHGGSEKYEAEVLTINDTCDLALVTVHEDAFWEGAHRPATGLSQIQQTAGSTGKLAACANPTVAACARVLC